MIEIKSNRLVWAEITKKYVFIFGIIMLALALIFLVKDTYTWQNQLSANNSKAPFPAGIWLQIFSTLTILSTVCWILLNARNKKLEKINQTLTIKPEAGIIIHRTEANGLPLESNWPVNQIKEIKITTIQTVLDKRLDRGLIRLRLVVDNHLGTNAISFFLPRAKNFTQVNQELELLKNSL